MAWVHDQGLGKGEKGNVFGELHFLRSARIMTLVGYNVDPSE